MRYWVMMIGAALLAGCSSEDAPRNDASGIAFERSQSNAAAPVPVQPDSREALAPEAHPVADPDPVPAGTPPPWAGTYAASQGACTDKPWVFDSAVIRPPDGRVCRIGQMSQPKPGKVSLIVSCRDKAGTTNELWTMDTRGGGLAIDRNNAGVTDHIALSRCG